MKKGIKILVIMLVTIVSTVSVKADTIQLNIQEISELTYDSVVLNTIYNEIIPNSGYNYYEIHYNDSYNILEIILFNEEIEMSMGFINIGGQQKFQIVASTDSNKYCSIVNTVGNTNYTCESGNSPISILTSSSTNYIYQMYDTNYNFRATSPIELKNYYSDDIIINNDDIFPTLKNLNQYNSWNDYNENQFTTVNLDDYYYVILSLKNYGRYQAYDVPLQVKGMIGITPIYNYGTSEKDTITDRCNISYSDFTDYRLYILEQDLQNNAVYAVKSCESGSSFKFKNSDFNITYVTDDNVNDPVVTINGVDYHTIPFASLSNTANSNEENNFIPGESRPATFSDIVSSVSDTLSGVWNTFTTFMSLVTRFFRALPGEFQAIAITSFTVMCTIGIIKFIRG